ncbi:MAG: hypothetical protein WDO13_19875 [Verrucomicrobiota bacterium]
MTPIRWMILSACLICAAAPIRAATGRPRHRAEQRRQWRHLRQDVHHDALGVSDIVALERAHVSEASSCATCATGARSTSSPRTTSSGSRRPGRPKA